VIVLLALSAHSNEKIVSAVRLFIVCDAEEGSPTGCGFSSVQAGVPFAAVQEKTSSVVQESITEPSYVTLLFSVPSFEVNTKRNGS
jgi:hypothetical protein